jgi:hypothetical protein
MWRDVGWIGRRTRNRSTSTCRSSLKPHRSPARKLGGDGLGRGARVRGPVDRAADDDVVGTSGDGGGGRARPRFWSPNGSWRRRAGPRRHDEVPAASGSARIACGLLRRADDAVRARLERAGSAFDGKVVQRCRQDEGRRRDRPGRGRSGSSPPRIFSAAARRRPRLAARTTCGSPWTVRKSRSNCASPRTAASTVAPMSNSFMSRKMRLPCVVLELAGKREPAAGQHAEADLVERHRIAEPARELEPGRLAFGTSSATIRRSSGMAILRLQAPADGMGPRLAQERSGTGRRREGWTCERGYRNG